MSRATYLGEGVVDLGEPKHVQFKGANASMQSRRVQKTARHALARRVCARASCDVLPQLEVALRLHGGGGQVGAG
eukprot:858582-Pleurochrysis_carterae.AAC.1